MVRFQKLPCGAGEIVFPCGTFEGHPEDYDFGDLRRVYLKMKKVLAIYQLSVDWLGLTMVQKNPDRYRDGRPGYEPEFRAEFVAVVGDINDPVLVWERFIAKPNKGIVSSIYVAGHKFSVTQFIGMCDLKRAMLFI